jgi:RsiW-degrading membrane proteinase PrsW (M82 family)
MLQVQRQPAPASTEVTRSPTPARPPRLRRTWVRILLGGLSLWVATVLVTFATRNANLIPTIILLGSFLVPVTFVVYAFGRADEVVTAQRVFSAFVYGGVLGTLGASLLEGEFLKSPSAGTYIYVGLIEEAVKLAALWLLARHLARYTVRDGIVLGAAVGFGFAALESAGYAFNALFTSGGLSLVNLVETEVLRGVLAPVGHGLWTAILGGVLFGAAARRGRLRPTVGVVGWYLVVAALHALWDASQQLAVWLTLLLTGTRMQWTLINQGQAPAPTPAQVHLYMALDWALLLVDALIGVLLLRLHWRRATRVERAAAIAARPAPRPAELRPTL